MKSLQTQFECWINDAAVPEFSAMKLHELECDIRSSDMLTLQAKSDLLRRIAAKFEQRYGNGFIEEPCGWRHV